MFSPVKFAVKVKCDLVRKVRRPAGVHTSSGVSKGGRLHSGTRGSMTGNLTRARREGGLGSV